MEEERGSQSEGGRAVGEGWGGGEGGHLLPCRGDLWPLPAKQMTFGVSSLGRLLALQQTVLFVASWQHHEGAALLLSRLLQYPRASRYFSLTAIR